MTVVAVINQKGGVGKTTIATNLAHSLALDSIPTLLIDLDPQAHSSLIFGDYAEYNFFVNNLFLNKNSFDPFQYIFAKDKKEKRSIDNLYILPSNLQLALIAEQLLGKVHREKILFNHFKRKDLFSSLKDWVIILDCPPNLGLLSINGIYAADQIIIPVNYGRYALEGMNDLIYIINEIKEDKKYTYHILRNNYDSRNAQTNKFIESQLQVYEKNLLKTQIRKCESLNQAQINGETIFSFEPKSNGAKDFNALKMEWLL